MRKIWYLLKCPEGDETAYLNGCQELMDLGETEEILCFRYQRMMRYGGTWHLENRMVLPGCIFIAETNGALKRKRKGDSEPGNFKLRSSKPRNFQRRGACSLIPCEVPYLKELCGNGSLIEMSRGIIRDGTVMVTSGPLKGRERLIRKIDRHKRTAEIEIPVAGDSKRITVGLEIYEKES